MSLIDLIKVLENGEKIRILDGANEVFFEWIDKESITIPLIYLDRVVENVRYSQLYNALIITIE